MCEVVMTNENLCKNFPDSHKYPGIEEHDEEDDLPQSLDNYSGTENAVSPKKPLFLKLTLISFDLIDLEFGLRRQRSNTAIRLEKMDRERKEAANITRVKWENPRPFALLPGN